MDVAEVDVYHSSVLLNDWSGICSLGDEKNGLSSPTFLRVICLDPRTCEKRRKPRSFQCEKERKPDKTVLHCCTSSIRTIFTLRFFKSENPRKTVLCTIKNNHTKIKVYQPTSSFTLHDGGRMQCSTNCLGKLDASQELKGCSASSMKRATNQTTGY
jgi:hypothetical protein